MKLEPSHRIDRIVPIDESQTTSLNEKPEKPIVLVAPRRARDDDKPVPFNKLIEKAIFIFNLFLKIKLLKSVK